MLGSHDIVAMRPPINAVRHRDGACEEAMVRPRVGVVRRGGCGALSLPHGKLELVRRSDRLVMYGYGERMTGVW